MSAKKKTDLLAHDPVREAAHELKTPIAAIRGFLELVQQAGELNALQNRYLDRAFGGLQRMETLIANLLETDPANADAPLHMTQTDLPKLVEDAVELIQGIAYSRGIDITVDIARDARLVEADARLLGQVLNNLLGNAVKYNRNQGWVSVQAVRLAEGVQVSVQDNGIGIPAEDQERIFQPFVRAHVSDGIEGSGLGLSIVATIIRQHGGRIWVESTPGKGSAFSFMLPDSTLPDAAPSDAVQPDSKLPDTKRRRVKGKLPQPGEVGDPAEDNYQENSDREL